VGAWGEPKHISGPVNSEGDENYPSVTKDGTLYFASTRATEHFSAGQPHIYRSRLVNGEYSAPELMPWTSDADDHMPTVAFDDSFMIFFSGGRGGWAAAICLSAFTGRMGPGQTRRIWALRSFRRL